MTNYKAFTKMVWVAEAFGTTYKGVPSYSEESGLITGFKTGDTGFIPDEYLDNITEINLETGASHILAVF